MDKQRMSEYKKEIKINRNGKLEAYVNKNKEEGKGGDIDSKTSCSLPNFLRKRPWTLT